MLFRSMILAAFAGISLGFRENSHLGLSFFMERMPESLKPFFHVIRFAFMLIFSVLMVWLSWQLVSTQMSVKQFSASMHLPMWVVYIPIFLGFILMFIRILQAFITHKAEKEEVL